jgi:hypothetical protein
MSLAYAPYNEDNLEDLKVTGTGLLEQKKQQRNNKTIKKRMADNVQTMLKTINNYDTLNNYDALENEELLDFNPPPKGEITTKKDLPISESDLMMQPTDSGNHSYKATPEPMMPAHSQSTMMPSNIMPNNMMAQPSNNMHQNMHPNMQTNLQNTMDPGFQHNNNNNKDALLEKLNYMIYLLEEQHDEKVGHVWEEIILYSFLGVFIIFIVDSFARIGKYER